MHLDAPGRERQRELERRRFGRGRRDGADLGRAAVAIGIERLHPEVIAGPWLETGRAHRRPGGIAGQYLPALTAFAVIDAVVHLPGALRGVPGDIDLRGRDGLGLEVARRGRDVAGEG